MKTIGVLKLIFYGVLRIFLQYLCMYQYVTLVYNTN